MAGLWIAVENGFLYDPRALSGTMKEEAGVVYWVSDKGNEYVLDLGEEALTEAARRNNLKE